MKLEYSIRIERLADGDGGGYLAIVPDLPGCISDGETPEEALRMCRRPSPHGSKRPGSGKWIFRSRRRLWRERGKSTITVRR
jgi:hypothetical protein